MKLVKKLLAAAAVGTLSLAAAAFPDKPVVVATGARTEVGRIAGLITIEDVLEQIVGEIEDEFDIQDDEGDIFGLSDRTYRVSGDTPVERVAEAFGVDLLAAQTDDDAPSFDTIGGLIAHEMGHVPRRGETFAFAGLQFVALHTRAGAVRWFKVSRVGAPAQA